jgi:hypothetical protein
VAIVNTRIMSHPVNWLIVLSMILIGGYLAHLLLMKFNPGLLSSLTGGGAVTSGPVQQNFAAPPSMAAAS